MKYELTNVVRPNPKQTLRTTQETALKQIKTSVIIKHLLTRHKLFLVSLYAFLVTMPYIISVARTVISRL